MGKVQRVFAALDFSPASDDALREAHERTSSSGGRLAVCHVIPNELRSNLLFPHISRITAVQFPREMDKISNLAAERVTSLTGRARGEYDLIVDDGAPQALILDHAEKWRADLIVMGHHGHTSAADALLGSVTTSVIRHAHCAVAITGKRGRQQASGCIVAGTDFSDSAVIALKAAALEAERTGAKLVAVHCLDLVWSAASYPAMAFGGAPFNISAEHIQELTQVAEQQLQKSLSDLGIRAESRVVTGAAGAALIETANALKASTIVVGTVGRTGLRRALLGSVAEAVAQGALCGVLIVR